MKSPTQIQPPANWQDFETLCKKLWGEIWCCTDTIKKNGRSGQNQCGVDVYGAPNNGLEYYGIQCKGKDNYTHSQLTIKEIDEEIEKALNFKPQLARFYFATTAVKDAKIEEYIRLKNIESQKAGGFAIEVFSWEDIVDKLIENRDTYNWYINDCQYIDNSNVDVQIIGKDFKLTPTIRLTTTKYVLHPHWNDPAQKQLFDILQQTKNSSWNLMSLRAPSKTNYSWCKIKFRITNIGSTVLSDYHLTVGFIDGVNDYDIGNSYCNDPLINPSERAYINSRIDNDRELFYSKTYRNAVEFRPKITKLVQEESQTFTVHVLTEINAEKVKLGWIFLSNGYKKEGFSEIEVINQIEEETKIIYVDSEEELQPPKSMLGYKIVEE